MNPNLSKHQFIVYWAHSKDTLKEGGVDEGHSFVTVADESHTAAKLTAEQMVAARGKEPTRTEWVP